MYSWTTTRKRFTLPISCKEWNQCTAKLSWERFVRGRIGKWRQNSEKWSEKQTLMVHEWKDRVEEVESRKSLEAHLEQGCRCCKQAKPQEYASSNTRQTSLKDVNTSNSKAGHESKSNSFVMHLMVRVRLWRPVVRMPGVVQSMHGSEPPSISANTTNTTSDSTTITMKASRERAKQTNETMPISLRSLIRNQEGKKAKKTRWRKW